MDLFLSAARDAESARYRVMDALKGIRSEFSRSRIYPSLSNLIDMYGVLRKVSDGGKSFSDDLPRRIVGLDLVNNRLVSEPVELPHAELQAITNLIEWALPEIVTMIEQGRTIFNFVDESLSVEEVGIIPSYIEEGYLLIPEAGRGTLHVLRYEVSIFTDANERYRNLKTVAVQTLPLSSIRQSPARLKQDLIELYRDLPNPATYYFNTDIEFPFNETLLPVAKRKLLRQISS